MVSRDELKNGLLRLGIRPGMALEVHCALSSFGELEGGAMTVIEVLKELVTEDGSIFMPALRFSRELPLTEEDRALGITVKIKILGPEAERTAMGAVADTFRRLPGTFCGSDTISIAGWGRHGAEALTGGLDYPLHRGGKALMIGVDIYKLTAMHYVEGLTPPDIWAPYGPDERVNSIYPPEEWVIERGHPPAKAWYRIQDLARERGLIREAMIGPSPVMLFDLGEVVSIYAEELRRDPYGLWGSRKDGMR